MAETNMKDVVKRQQEQQWLHACDPVTLVRAAREQVNDVFLGKSNLEAARPYLEEILTRFDQQARATIGQATFSGIRIPQGSGSSGSQYE